MSNETMIKLTIELLVAVSHYLWPLITLIIVLMFKSPLRELLGRVRKGKLFGQELELDPILNEFRESVKQAEVEILQLPPPIETVENKATASELKAIEEEIRQDDDEINKTLDDSRVNPEIAILRLSALLDKELRELLASTGWMPPRKNISASEALRILDNKGQLPKDAINSLNIFRDLRNKIVHGHVVDKRNILQVLDIGLILLKTIRAIPHEVNVVHDVVSIYGDQECTQLVTDAKGLILETTSPGVGLKSKRIFPTTNGSYYQKGKRISWEWDSSKSWDDAWYIDPDDGKKKYAWTSSSEFVGKHLDKL